MWHEEQSFRVFRGNFLRAKREQLATEARKNNNLLPLHLSTLMWHEERSFRVFRGNSLRAKREQLVTEGTEATFFERSEKLFLKPKFL